MQNRRVSRSVKMIYKLTAVGASALTVTIALTPAALGAGTSGAGAARPGHLPNTNIKGKPAHFSPSTFSAKARWTSPNPCSPSQASFTISNLTGNKQVVHFKGTSPFTPFTVTVSAHNVSGVCITPKGWTGTLTGKISDGKTLTVTFH